ncbi:MAG TPA: hypothetical protein VE398_06575 [Acidobacteriota bacterium]|nr:hypothetical protein [Acidobacteriota bacterium]
MTRRFWLINCLVGALLIASAALVVDSFVYQFTEVNETAGDVLDSLVWLSPILFFSLIALIVILRCHDDKRLHRIGLLIILFSLFCRLAWVCYFDSYQVNDFGFYLNCGADTAASGNPVASRFCGAEYWKRSAVYTYPIALLFGRSLLAIKLVNVVLATLTSLIFFRLGILVVGARLAAISLLSFIWQPDLWYAMTLASPDIPGLFWLAVFFYLCAVLQRRLFGLGVPRWTGLRLACLSVLLGVIVFFLDFTRTYHYSAILALGCYVVLESLLVYFPKPDKTSANTETSEAVSVPSRFRMVAVYVVVWLLLPVGTYLLMSQGFWKLWRIPQEFGGSNLLCEVTAMDVLGINSYEEIKDWALEQCPSLDQDEEAAFAARKLLHELTYSPSEFFRYLQRKNENLGLADDYLDWSTYARPETWDTSSPKVKHLNQRFVPEQRGAIAVAHALLLLLVLWRLLLYPRHPFGRQEWIMLCFSGSLYALLLVLLESQPRYDIFLIFIFSWMAALALDDIFRRLMRKTLVSASSPVSRMQFYRGGIVLIGILVGAYWSAALAIRGSPLTLRDQTGFVSAKADLLPLELRPSPMVTPIFVKNNFKEVLLAYPAGSPVQVNSLLAAQRSFSVPRRTGHHLRFFISVSAATGEPFDNKLNWEDTDLECLVAVNGNIVVREKLKEIDGGNHYVSLTEDDGIVFTPQTTIQFIVRNCSGIENVAADRAPVAALEYIDLQ